MQTQEQLADDSIRQERVFARLSTAFALLALSLAAIGLYGNLAYAVTRRTSEIGVRIALGAVSRDVIWMVVQGSVRFVIAGTLIGCFLAWSCTRLLVDKLYGVQPMDERVIEASIFVLLGISVLAAVLPAWRASRIDPLAALRYE